MCETSVRNARAKHNNNCKQAFFATRNTRRRDVRNNTLCCVIQLCRMHHDRRWSETHHQCLLLDFVPCAKHIAFHTYETHALQVYKALRSELCETCFGSVRNSVWTCPGGHTYLCTERDVRIVTYVCLTYLKIFWYVKRLCGSVFPGSLRTSIRLSGHYYTFIRKGDSVTQRIYY